jgi:hypothetical protein
VGAFLTPNKYMNNQDHPERGDKEMKERKEKSVPSIVDACSPSKRFASKSFWSRPVPGKASILRELISFM